MLISWLQPLKMVAVRKKQYSFHSPISFSIQHTINVVVHRSVDVVYIHFQDWKQSDKNKPLYDYIKKFLLVTES